MNICIKCNFDHLSVIKFSKHGISVLMCN